MKRPTLKTNVWIPFLLLATGRGGSVFVVGTGWKSFSFVGWVTCNQLSSGWFSAWLSKSLSDRLIAPALNSNNTIHVTSVNKTIFKQHDLRRDKIAICGGVRVYPLCITVLWREQRSRLKLEITIPDLPSPLWHLWKWQSATVAFFHLKNYTFSAFE